MKRVPLGKASGMQGSTIGPPCDDAAVIASCSRPPIMPGTAVAKAGQVGRATRVAHSAHTASLMALILIEAVGASH
jgi:hypothetical protein